MDFISIESNISSEIVEKKSKFICNLIKVQSQEEAEKMIKQIRKKYFDARHNCIAYRVYEEDKIVEKASDDGEPSGTAGGPMLNILRNQNLINVLVVVTRYFGGILLGTGGLVRVYSEATLEAIEKAIKIKLILGLSAKVVLDYPSFNTFKYYCQKNDIKIIDVQYLENIVCKILMDEKIKNKILDDFQTKKLILKEINFIGNEFIAKSI